MEPIFGSPAAAGHEKQGSTKSRAEAGEHETATPPPHPEAFSKPQTEPYCHSQAKFNF